MSVNSSRTIYSLPTPAGQTVNCLSGDQQSQTPVVKPENSSGDTLPMTNLVKAMTSRYGNVDYQDSEVPRVGTQSHREHKKCDEQLRHQNPKENNSQADAFPMSNMVKAMTGRYENVEDREKDDWDDNLEDDIFSETSANQCEDSIIDSVSNNGRKAQLVYRYDSKFHKSSHLISPLIKMELGLLNFTSMLCTVLTQTNVRTPNAADCSK